MRVYPMLTHRKAVGTIAYMGGFMSPPEPFVWSWTQMLLYSQEVLCEPGEFIHPVHSRYGLHDFARNEIVEKMQGDWLMMVDADHTFDPDLCARLVMRMYQHDLDVVTGLYVYKNRPVAPVLYMRNPDNGAYEHVTQFDRTLDLIPVHSAGAGCLLIRRRVFERIIAELKQDCFDRIGKLGEDHSFFLRVQKLGIQVWCAWKVQAGHLRYQPMWWDVAGADRQADQLKLHYYQFASKEGDPALDEATGLGPLSDVPAISPEAVPSNTGLSRVTAPAVDLPANL